MQTTQKGWESHAAMRAMHMAEQVHHWLSPGVTGVDFETMTKKRTKLREQKVDGQRTGQKCKVSGQSNKNYDHGRLAGKGQRTWLTRKTPYPEVERSWCQLRKAGCLMVRGSPLPGIAHALLSIKPNLVQLDAPAKVRYRCPDHRQILSMRWWKKTPNKLHFGLILFEGCRGI